jgi:hypothetical protein
MPRARATGVQTRRFQLSQSCSRQALLEGLRVRLALEPASAAGRPAAGLVVADAAIGEGNASSSHGTHSTPSSRPPPKFHGDRDMLEIHEAFMSLACAVICQRYLRAL